jgi:hypothetical protein
VRASGAGEAGGAAAEAAAEAAALEVAAAAALQEVIAALRQAGLELGADAEATAMALTEAAGGLDNLLGALQRLKALYLSDAELLAETTSQLEEAFSSIGLALPDTRTELRALVESLDLSTDAGRSAYVSILAVSDALGQVFEASEAAAAAAAEAARLEAEAAAEAASALEVLIYSERELAQLAMARAAAEANAIATGLLAIDISKLSQAQFIWTVKALGGVGAQGAGHLEVALAGLGVAAPRGFFGELEPGVLKLRVHVANLLHLAAEVLAVR